MRDVKMNATIASVPTKTDGSLPRKLLVCVTFHFDEGRLKYLDLNRHSSRNSEIT